MKLCFILPSLANKGPVLVCKDIVDNLINQVEECVVYYFDEVIEVNFACEVKKISFFSTVNLDRFDVVHSHMFRPDLFLAMRSFLRQRKYRTVSTIHTAIYDDLKFAYSKLKTAILPPLWTQAWKSLDAVVVLTNFAKSYYPTLKNVRVIPNGRSISIEKIDEQDLPLLNSYKANFKILGTVVSFDDRKGLYQVIDSLTSLPEYAFVIVGSGSESVKNELLNQAKLLQVEERLLFLGKRPKGDRYMPYFDVYVIPSVSEGLPLALIEAAAHRVPIVCSDIPVFKEIFTEDEVGFFSLHNSASLAATVISTSSKPQQIDLAFKRYCKEYTPQVMGQNYFRLYTSLTEMR